MRKSTRNVSAECAVQKYLNNSDVSLKIRIWFYVIAFTHLAVMAIKLLTIDFRKADDPELWMYQEFRWKLITSWFNLLSLAYLPVCIYCDWRELNRESSRRHVQVLNRIRFICFTSILLPTTFFADTFFWRLWYKDRELVAPSSIDHIVPFWTQHCMHTISLLVVIVDLLFHLLVPRKRPKSLIPGLAVMFVFIGSYTGVCVHSILQEQYIYPVLKLFSFPKLIILILFVILEHCLYYTTQWKIIEVIWIKKYTSSSKTSRIIKHKRVDGRSFSDFRTLLQTVFNRLVTVFGICESLI